MKCFTTTIIATIIAIAFVSCKKDSNNNGAGPITGHGIYIVNEGAFGNSDASISYYDINSGSISNNIFFSTNNFPVGDVAQSMAIHEGKGYIVVNNSQKIEVVNAENCSSIATITGFSGPRYFIGMGNKGYVSDWFDNEIKVIDLNSNSIVANISTGNGPEQLMIINNKLFVCNVGGWSSDSTVTIIDLSTQMVDTTLVVGLNPNSIQLDNNGKLWVLCGGSTGPDYTGGTADDIAGSLWMIEPATNTVIGSQTFQSADHPVKLTYSSTDGKMLLLKGIDGYTGSIFSFDTGSMPVNLTMLNTKKFYGLDIDHTSSMIYAGFAPSFSQNGLIFKIGFSGTVVDSAEAGIAPNGFAIKE